MLAGLREYESEYVAYMSTYLSRYVHFAHIRSFPVCTLHYTTLHYTTLYSSSAPHSKNQIRVHVTVPSKTNHIFLFSRLFLLLFRASQRNIICMSTASRCTHVTLSHAEAPGRVAVTVCRDSTLARSGTKRYRFWTRRDTLMLVTVHMDLGP